MKITNKEFHAFVAPFVKALHRAANDYCVNGMGRFTAPAGYVASHYRETKGDGATIEWNGFTIEFSMCRRARVVCNVPTPYSLMTFNYCLKRDGKQLAHGTTLPEFVTHAMWKIKEELVA